MAMIMEPILLKDITLVPTNFGEPSKNQEGRLGKNSIKTLSFFPSNSYLYFEIYSKEVKLFSLVFIEHGDHFTFLNSLGTYLERRYFIEFNSVSCAIPKVDEYEFIIANCVSCVLGDKDRRSMEKELGPVLEDLSISLSLNPSSLCYEVSLEELKIFVGFLYFSSSLVGDMCIIALEGNLFLLMPSMTNFLSSHFSLEDPLINSSVMFDPSCYGFGNLDDTSLVELNSVGFALEFDSNSLQYVCTITSTGGRRHTMEFKCIGESELCDLWNSYGVATLVNKLGALISYSLLTLECLGNFHSVMPFNALNSHVAHHLWLFGGIGENESFQKRGEWYDSGYQETIELLQGSVTRAMARKREEEYQEKIAIFEKMIRDLAWQVNGA
ncbi:hypothetical protein M9H77_16440 [Catharanthus roseus]|uniref:Uncharacterized protein n=1 Tax=Catharanthus roseus TaxID=4058 RepID=A0ACC0B1S6_CATRO|nr:hypothetical protein M9H77_16440 [Catharanthus roseus]